MDLVGELVISQAMVTHNPDLDGLELENFKKAARQLQKITDPGDNEMIMVRGQCYPILWLHELYKVKAGNTSFSAGGIIIMVENEDKTFCIFADKLLREQQVVVKALPNYMKNGRKIRGVAGCTLLGDGSISLILDVDGLLSVGLS